MNSRGHLSGRRVNWQEHQDDAGNLGWAELATVERAVNPADDRRRLSVSREAFRTFSGPDIFRLKECGDDPGKRFHLRLAAIRNVGREATGQLGESDRRRALFPRIRHGVSSP